MSHVSAEIIGRGDSHHASRLLPLYESLISAGFPSPADDYVEQKIDLNEVVAQRPESTFFLRVEGDSMKDTGILPGDLLVVDRSADPGDGDIVIAVLGGELTVKRLRIRDGDLLLMPENSSHEPIRVDLELQVWGVVTHAIHSF